MVLLVIGLYLGAMLVPSHWAEIVYVPVDNVCAGINKVATLLINVAVEVTVLIVNATIVPVKIVVVLSCAVKVNGKDELDGFALEDNVNVEYKFAALLIGNEIVLVGVPR